MSKDLGVTVIIENKPGAGTIIGTQVVAASAPDGYTLLMGTFANAVNRSLQAKLPYDAHGDFCGEWRWWRGRSTWSWSTRRPRSHRFPELIAAAKAESPTNSLTAPTAPGTSAHLAGELFKHMAKVNLTTISIQGATPAITDLLGGQIRVIFTTVASAASLVESGQLRAIAVTSAERSPAFPQLPTVSEAGVLGYAAEAWYGVYAPAKTPAEIIDRLNKSAAKAVQSEAFKKLASTKASAWWPRRRKRSTAIFAARKSAGAR